ncbi:MAG: pirin family protein [Sphingomonadales bacterium]
MTDKPLLETQTAEETSDGEGVSIRRSLGLRPSRWHDPFLLLDEFYSNGPDAGPGFPDHPHRGFSTLTYMIKGHMNHADNKGNAGRVGPGGFQWMTAGKGIIHSERPEVEEDGMRGMQLWVNLPGSLKMREPFYINGEAEDVPEVKIDGGSVRVLGGKFEGQTGPITDDVTELVYFDVQLEGNGTFSAPLPEGHNALFYTIDGEVEYTASDKGPLPAYTLGLLDKGEQVKFKAGSGGARFVLIAGKPLREPIARHGPFVMNTREEIEKAISDYQGGLF